MCTRKWLRQAENDKDWTQPWTPSKKLPAQPSTFELEPRIPPCPPLMLGFGNALGSAARAVFDAMAELLHGRGQGRVRPRPRRGLDFRGPPQGVGHHQPRPPARRATLRRIRESLRQGPQGPEQTDRCRSGGKIFRKLHISEISERPQCFGTILRCVMWKTAPLGWLARHSISQPWASTICCTIARPSPVPFCWVVK